MTLTERFYITPYAQRQTGARATGHLRNGRGNERRFIRKAADGSLYADDTLSESVTEFAKRERLSWELKTLTEGVLAELLGQAVDKNSVVWAGKRTNRRMVAVGFRASKKRVVIPLRMYCLKQNLKYRLKVRNKGREYQV